MPRQTRTHEERRTAVAERRSHRGEVDDPGIVMDAAAMFLAVRPRSVEQTRRRLWHLGYAHPLADQVVERLIEMRYLDDESFARAWVESRDRARPRGASVLRHELALKGIARETIDLVLDQRMAVASEGDGDPDKIQPDADQAAAMHLLEKRSSSLLREPDLRKRRQKAYLLLARNGFSPDVCRDIAESFLRAADEVTPGNV